MKYIEKTIMTATGVQATAWLAIDLSAQLCPNRVPTDGAQPGRILLLGWKDEAAMMAGMAPLESKPYEVADISQLDSYAAMMTELVTGMVTHADSPFLGGTVKDTPAIVVPDPVVPEE